MSNEQSCLLDGDYVGQTTRIAWVIRAADGTYERWEQVVEWDGTDWLGDEAPEYCGDASAEAADYAESFPPSPYDKENMAVEDGEEIIALLECEERVYPCRRCERKLPLGRVLLDDYQYMAMTPEQREEACWQYVDDEGGSYVCVDCSLAEQDEPIKLYQPAE